MTEKKVNKLLVNPLFIIFALLTVVGLVCWFLQLTKGLQLTNLNNFNTWGLYIAGFTLFTGVAAGSLMFASSAYLFEFMREFRPYTRIAAFVGAIGSVVAAGLFIIVDIGNPGRVWNMIISANVASPMFWDAVILVAYVVIGIVLTRQLILVHDGQKDEESVKEIALIAFIAGLAVMITSFIFAMQVAQPTWNSTVQPVSFLAAALVAALSLLLIIYAILNKTGYIDMDEGKFAKIAKIAAAFLFFELFVILGETAMGLYTAGGEQTVVTKWLMFGDGKLFFWAQMIAIVAAVILLMTKNVRAIVGGAALAVFGITMIKYNLLQAELLNPLISYAGPPGYGVGEGSYFPALIEIGVSVGIISLGGLLVMLGLSMLNLGNRTEQI